MNAKINFSRDIPVKVETEIFIAGGGPAGIAAALAARTQNSKVYLAEAHSCLGGMGTAGLVPAFMNFHDCVNYCADGIGRKIQEAFWDAGGAYPAKGNNIKPEVLKRVYDDLMLESGADFTFHTQAIAVIKNGNRIDHVICSGKSGLFAVKAKVFIDATGDGDLSVMAGAEYAKGDDNGEMMPGTLCSQWSGIDWQKVHKNGLGQGNSQIEKAFEDKVFTYEDRHLSGMWQVSESLGGGNIGHTFDVDGTDERSLTKALAWGRKSMLEYEKYYKEYLKGFEDMELVSTGSLLGVRETRRIIGDYILNINDFRNSVFEDEIGRYSYPVDIHIARPDKESYKKFENEFKTLRHTAGENYGIPYRTLTPKGIDNLLTAGRCISTDRQMQASIRVMPCCFITGQAAGIAASITQKDNTSSHKINIAELQRKLKEIGAFLPNS
jgi:hypothetical protein